MLILNYSKANYFTHEKRRNKLPTNNKLSKAFINQHYVAFECMKLFSRTKKTLKQARNIAQVFDLMIYECSKFVLLLICEKLGEMFCKHPTPSLGETFLMEVEM